MPTSVSFSMICPGEFRMLHLLVSTARQWLIYEGLGATPPAFYHEDLVKDETGERLAKRNDSLALRTLFSKGHTQDSLEKLWIESS